MNTEKMKLDELYPERDAASRRDLEVLANSISQFRAAVHHIASQGEPAQVAWQLEQARQRRRSVRRRLVLEWAMAAVTAIVLCAAAVVPTVNSHREHVAQLQAQRQAQILKQREADSALLDQVTSELSEAVPDSMQPLAEMGADHVSYQSTAGETEKNNGRN
ncbi:hypothetical protein [Alloacidobacterium sp.]|uniref:hypothetical protein n=1 Tax=Alloacidobacterium sp. TaxID=2951999 RepID=UPI002D66E6D5|nr:hypothetical protein [Alloacidobacterium sp.]HYK35372.1 hypothetical protein [Alloacidobacterium sp.]